MIPAVRQQTILDLLKKSNTILYVDDLSAKLKVSSSTLRRDLKELAENDQLTLLHGGGVKLIERKNMEQNIISKLSINKEAKIHIAQKACEFIEDGDVIFIDPSSTTYQMIPFLANRNITVITNGILHINRLVSNHIPSIMIGGDIKAATNSCIGPIAESDLKAFHFNKCFLGSNGFSIKSGITNHDINECKIKKLAIEKAEQSFFLLDSSKYGVVTMVHITDISTPTIITDSKIPELKDLPNIILA